MINLNRCLDCKEGNTVTRGILFNEMVLVNYCIREINQEPTTTYKAINNLAANLIKQVSMLLYEYKDLTAKNVR